MEALRAAKKKLDPEGIMNPGVLFDAWPRSAAGAHHGAQERLVLSREHPARVEDHAVALDARDDRRRRPSRSRAMPPLGVAFERDARGGHALLGESTASRKGIERHGLAR